MTTEFNTEAFATAYVAANKIAQEQDTRSPEFKCAYEIAAELGHARDSMEWDAAVGGAAAFFFKGHRF